MAPTLKTAERRRYWLVGTMVFENLFFSAVLLGWSSLLPVLLEEGFFSNVCQQDGTMLDGDNTTHQALVAMEDDYNETISNISSTLSPLPGDYPRCGKQDEKLNLAFTVGSFLLSGLTFPIGLAMDKFGSRLLRILGAVMFIISCLLFGWATVETSWFLFPAVALNGVGGIMVTFTSFQVANLFPAKRSTIISFSIGSYASAAILFLILKILYDLGMSRQYIFTGVAIATIFVIINCIINVPTEAIPDPEDAKFGMHWHILRTDHKVTGKQFYSIVSSVGRRLSIDEQKPPEEILLRKGSKIYSSQHNLELQLNLDAIKKKSKKSSKDLSLVGNVFTPLYLLSLIVMCITQLRLLFFIGSLQSMLLGVTGGDTETVNSYIYIFGILQLMCLATSPLIGSVMDYKIKETLDNLKGKQRRRSNSQKRSMSLANRLGDDNVFMDETNDIVKNISRKSSLPDLNRLNMFGNFGRSKSIDIGNGKLPVRGSRPSSRLSSTDSAGSDTTDGEKPPMNLKIRKLLNGACAFGITNTLLMLFGVTVLIPTLQVQIISFILHTVIRGFIHSACCGLYAIIYPASQVGSLIGLQSLISACFTLFQYPIFIIIQGPLEGNPFYMNVILLLMTLLNYGMPIYMIYLAKKLRRKQKNEAVEEDKQTLLSSRPSKNTLAAVPEHV